VVSLFTRNQGKVKGVARHALSSRKRFGGALEPATQVRAYYMERPHQDLVQLNQFEILISSRFYGRRFAGRSALRVWLRFNWSLRCWKRRSRSRPRRTTSFAWH
jgi:DNA repair protein RecO (recombination protein O)